MFALSLEDQPFFLSYSLHAPFSFLFEEENLWHHSAMGPTTLSSSLLRHSDLPLTSSSTEVEGR